MYIKLYNSKMEYSHFTIFDYLAACLCFPALPIYMPFMMLDIKPATAIHMQP